jgi:hypothetical protein
MRAERWWAMYGMVYIDERGNATDRCWDASRREKDGSGGGSYDKNMEIPQKAANFGWNKRQMKGRGAYELGHGMRFGC